MPGRRRGRPKNKRFVSSVPVADYFKPRGIPLSKLEVETLTLEELEAIRLSDIEGLTQGEAANRMGVSRKAFWRDLVSAREKIAQALLHGKAIQIQGGDYLIENHIYWCKDCGNRWTIKMGETHYKKCPVCGGENIEKYAPPPAVPHHRRVRGKGSFKGGGGRGTP